MNARRPVASKRSAKVADAISRHMPVWVTWPEAERSAALAQAIDEAFNSKPSREMIRQVAAVIDGVSFSCTPELYGLRTEAELEENTLVGAARSIALKKAEDVVRIVRASQ